MRQNPRTELALKGQKEEPPLSTGATHIFMTAGGRRGAGQDTEKWPPGCRVPGHCCWHRQDDYSPWEGTKPGLGTCIVCTDMVRFEGAPYTGGELSDSPFTSLGTGRAGTSQEPSESDWEEQCEKQMGPSCFYNSPVFVIKLSSAHASRLPTQNLHVLQTKLHQHVWGLKFLSVINYILAWLLSTLLSKDKTQWHQFLPQMPLLSSCSLLNQASAPVQLCPSLPLLVCYHSSPASAGPGHISMLNEHQVWAVWWASKWPVIRLSIDLHLCSKSDISRMSHIYCACTHPLHDADRRAEAFQRD